ncbi:ribonuclease E inhibitor RraB [Rhizobacter sp. AJA081-3]|uniref:ribonuclease E inhibitor RraB n=1 Tax=Rhizobacter sp. AJA081-3 TaxID=2753607 RepID=UPI001AE010EE|nr:ribonuclease E inhibitor RraB [Rhizobacter sp. AJA081-3]
MSKASVFALLFVAVAAALGVLLLLRGASAAEPTGDAAVIAQLRNAGSDLTKPHPVEFFMYFPTEAAAKRVADKLNSQGFTASVKPAASGGLPWHTFATRRLVPTVEAMVKLRAELTALCALEGGEYDGWGTPIVK